MEHRQNWHKFQRVLGYVPPKKTGLMVLHSNQRVLAGAVGVPADSPSRLGFTDVGMSFDTVESAWEVLQHKYAASGTTFIDREELMTALGQVAGIRATGAATENFPAQMAKLHELLGLDKSEKNSLAAHMGDKPFDQYWPRKPFLLSFFKSFLGELFPERKLLLVSVIDDSENMDCLLLEFQGRELKAFCDPDFSGLDWRGKDLYLNETAAQFVQWCETRYMLPTYSLFVSRGTWESCRAEQTKQGNRNAWKSLLKAKNLRDVEKEVLFEPEPWPVKALLRWHAFSGR